MARYRSLGGIVKFPDGTSKYWGECTKAEKEAIRPVKFEVVRWYTKRVKCECGHGFLTKRDTRWFGEHNTPPGLLRSWAGVLKLVGNRKFKIQTWIDQPRWHRRTAPLARIIRVTVGER